MTATLPNKELLLPREVATHFRKSVRTIYRWIDEGVIRGAVKIGPSVRIPREVVEAMPQPIDD